MHLFIDALVWKKEMLHCISYINFTFELINIKCWQIWHYCWQILTLCILGRWFSNVAHFDKLICILCRKVFLPTFTTFHQILQNLLLTNFCEFLTNFYYIYLPKQFTNMNHFLLITINFYYIPTSYTNIYLFYYFHRFLPPAFLNFAPINWPIFILPNASSKNICI